MMIGCCAQLDDYITVKNQKYDYIELSAMELMTHDDQSFRDFLVLYRNTGFPCRGFNSFCGAALPIVGPDQSTSQETPALCSMRLVRLFATTKSAYRPHQRV